MIKKIDGKYVVLSERTGRRFGTYDTLEEAKKRLKQIEFFKHFKKSREDENRPFNYAQGDFLFTLSLLK